MKFVGKNFLGDTTFDLIRDRAWIQTRSQGLWRQINAVEAFIESTVQKQSMAIMDVVTEALDNG